MVAGFIEGKRAARHLPALQVLAPRGEPERGRCLGHEPRDPRLHVIRVDQLGRAAIGRVRRIRGVGGVDEFAGFFSDGVHRLFAVGEFDDAPGKAGKEIIEEQAHVEGADLEEFEGGFAGPAHRECAIVNFREAFDRGEGDEAAHRVAADDCRVGLAVFSDEVAAEGFGVEDAFAGGPALIRIAALRDGEAEILAGVDHLTVEAESPIRTVLTVAMGGDAVSVPIEPGKVVVFNVPASGQRGFQSYAYLLQATSSEGFVPRLMDNQSRDYRNLGAQMRFSPVFKTEQ